MALLAFLPLLLSCTKSVVTSWLQQDKTLSILQGERVKEEGWWVKAEERLKPWLNFFFCVSEGLRRGGGRRVVGSAVGMKGAEKKGAESSFSLSFLLKPLCFHVSPFHIKVNLSLPLAANSY